MSCGSQGFTTCKTTPKTRTYMIRYYLRICVTLLFSKYPYSRVRLAKDYFSLLGRSILFHKFSKPGKKKQQEENRAKLLGFDIQFFGYAQLLTLIEEIFIYQIYKFDSDKVDPCIIDCGSNIGVSILYFKLLFPKSKIYAFEPDPECFCKLEHNISVNLLENVNLFNLGLWDRTGEAILHKRGSVPGYLGMSLRVYDAADLELPVAVQKLSDFIDGDVELIKIDVEGCEREIIQDLIINGKLAHVRQMLIEVHSMAVSESDLVSSLSQKKFKCRRVSSRFETTLESTIHCFAASNSE